MSESAITENQSEPGLAQTIFKNTVYITIGEIVLKAVTFLFNIYVIRQLGDESFGQYSIVLAFVGLFQIFAELGMTQYVMREIARDRSKTQSLFWDLVTLRTLLAVLGIIGITLSGVMVGYSPELVLGIFIYTFSFLLSAFLAPLIAVLTANERLDYVTARSILGRVIFMVLSTIFLLNGFSFIALIVANLISIPLQIGLALWGIRRHRLASLSFQIQPRTWSHLIRASLPFGLISLTLTIAFSIDTVMLSWYQPEYVVGWYNVAYNLVFSLMFFVSGFNEAIVPSLSRTYVNDPVQVERWYYRSVKFIAILSLPLAVGGMIIAYALIRFLYTDEFLPSALALQILIWDVPLLMFSSFCGNMTTIVGEERAAARIYGINAIANVILNFYAIPHYGLVGASIVTVITDLIGALQFHFLLKRKLKLPNMTWVLVRALTAAGLMGLVLKLAGDLNQFILIALGAGVYGGLVLGLRLLGEPEWAMILRLTGRRGASQPVKETV